MTARTQLPNCPKQPDRNCLSYWFPLIEAVGLPVPKTTIVLADKDLAPLAYGESVAGFDHFLGRLSAAAEAMGYPFFLRTGQGSGKHHWLDTCYVTAEADLGQHVYNLVEWSNCVDVFGLPTTVWAVREMLPTKPYFTAFKGMPICKEFRVFVDGAEVVCVHPYWPRGVLVEGFPMEPGADWEDGARQIPDGFDEAYKSLCDLPRYTADRFEVTRIAAIAGLTLGGAWSVDMLATERGWYLTDMAEAHRSFHWDGCEHAKWFAAEE